MYTYQELLTLVEEGVENISFNTSGPNKLYEPIKYSLANGGKRLRPMLCCIAAQAFGGKEAVKQVMNTALALEVFHNFTLLHDDLMDNSPIRRGKPTVYKKWGGNVAILSGDAMLTQAYVLLAGTSRKELIAQTLDLFNKMSLEIYEGQQYDMEFEDRDDVTEQEYLRMIRLKTAVLLATALKIGAIYGGASLMEADLLYDFGISLGLAFQLQDDFLDVYGDEKVFGKPIGGDISNNKKTMLLIKTMNKADEMQRKELNKDRKSVV